MYPYLNETDKKILELLYTYHFGWTQDIATMIDKRKSITYERLTYLQEEAKYVQSKSLPGTRKKRVYGLTEDGFQFLKKQFGFNEQHIENRDTRFEMLSDGFIRHECLVLHVAARFFEAGKQGDFLVYDRRTILTHLTKEARQMRTDERVKLLEVRPGPDGTETTHRADDFLIIKKPRERPRAVFVEIDRGTESLRDRNGKAKGKVSKMMRAYIEAYRSKFFRTYAGRDYKPLVLFVLETPYNASTRLQNFIDLWREIGAGEAEGLPRFIPLQEFDTIAIEEERFHGLDGLGSVV